jgi:predicted enzyme related to lactoylglutathione lyase
MTMRKVVHFEIPADDISRAKAFYGSVFEWEMETMQMGEAAYTTATTTPFDREKRVLTEVGGINGGMVQRSPEMPAPVITIEVEAIDDSLKQIEAAGGTTVMARTAIPDMGAFAYFKDTEGNVMGLWETV